MTSTRTLFLPLILGAAALTAQNPGITRTVVQRQEVSVPGRDAAVVRVEIAPHSYAGRHTHPGEEISYVTEGELELLIDGQPPRDVKVGESFIIPPNTKHDGHNKGDVPVKFIGVYLIDKGAALATPVQ